MSATPDHPRSAAIVGAGLGGLTAALALLQRGWAVHLYEQAPVVGEVGAGLSLSRGVLNAFKALGVLEDIRRAALRVNGLPFLHYQTGALLAGDFDRTDGAIPPGEADAAGLPLVSLQIHRADLHAILVAAFTARAPGCLTLGARLEKFGRAGERAVLNFANGMTAEADLAIGADGVKSVMRTSLWDTPPARFTGQVAYRCLIDGAAAQPYLGAGRAAVFLGPGCVFNRYTLRGGRLLNCVSIVRTAGWQSEGWSNPTTRDDLLAQHPGWHPDVRGVLAIAPESGLIRWGIFDHPALPQWSAAPFTLLGDAAHPMLPFLGLGAAMAIEDGYVLGRALETGTLAEGLARYEAARRPRTEQIARLSRHQGELLQSQDPDHFQVAEPPSGNRALFTFDPVTAPV